MNERDYTQARTSFLETGGLDPELVVLLRRTVARLIRFGGLPPIYSPTGHWDHEAEREVLGDWMAARLFGTGQLAALLQQAATPGSFMRIGELYLRRHLINRLARSQAGNLYARVRDLLAEDDAFEPAATDSYWQISGNPAAPFDADERELARAAWRLGHFETIRYREDAKKLSPLLEREDLHRFVAGVLVETGAALTLAQIVRALVLRFDLEPAGMAPLDDHEDRLPAPVDIVEEVTAAQAARAVLSELTARQVSILRLQIDDQSVREIAAEVGVSVGTVSAEQKINAEVLARISDDQGASRGALLNTLRDLLFIEEEHS